MRAQELRALELDPRGRVQAALAATAGVERVSVDSDEHTGAMGLAVVNSVVVEVNSVAFEVSERVLVAVSGI